MARTLPILGFVGSSGSGKTTLLAQLPRLDLDDLPQVASFVADRLGLRWSACDHSSDAAGEAHHG